MEKVFETTQRIALQEPGRTRLRRLWQWCKAFLSFRRRVSAAALPEAVECIFDSFYRNLRYDCIFPLLIGYYRPILKYLPQYNRTMSIPLRKGGCGYVVKVLKKGLKGEESSASWLIRRGKGGTTLSLYLSAPQMRELLDERDNQRNMA